MPYLPVSAVGMLGSTKTQSWTSLNGVTNPCSQTLSALVLMAITASLYGQQHSAGCSLLLYFMLFHTSHRAAPYLAVTPETAVLQAS